jgi:hypothetical protein
MKKHRSVFTLKDRAARVNSRHTDELLAPSLLQEAIDDELSDPDAVSDPHCSGKPATGNQQARAHFGQQHTHNEELCVTSCGIVIGRATFYGSEAPNGVVVRRFRHCLILLFLMRPQEFWLRLFPTLASMPQILWHDNNCQIYGMLQNEPDEVRQRFAGSILPVDVWHFNCKHKESDTVCNEHCNPAFFEDVTLQDGQWRFNSSAAEQTNAWFGRFLPIMRGMESVRYNFVLDELIKRRNRVRVAELKRQGHAPYSIPRHVLLG